MERQIQCHRETKRHGETVTERDRGERDSVVVEVTVAVQFSPFQSILYR